jgi:hypothetical protein
MSVSDMHSNSLSIDVIAAVRSKKGGTMNAAHGRPKRGLIYTMYMPSSGISLESTIEP